MNKPNKENYVKSNPDQVGLHSREIYVVYNDPDSDKYSEGDRSYTYHTHDSFIDPKTITPRDKVTVDYSVTSQQIKNLTGRILTIIDAAIANSSQNKAIKDLIRNEMMEEFQFYSDLMFPFIDDEYVEKYIADNNPPQVDPPTTEEILGA